VRIAAVVIRSFVIVVSEIVVSEIQKFWFPTFDAPTFQPSMHQGVCAEGRSKSSSRSRHDTPAWRYRILSLYLRFCSDDHETVNVSPTLRAAVDQTRF
jgi:hypothetical protein